LADQARRDLDELDLQVEAGEIDEETAATLRHGYLAELESATDALTDMPLEDDTPADDERPSTNRTLIGATILVAAVALIIGFAASMAQDRDTGPVEGVASNGEVDLDSISNEQMEAVVESYRNDPAVAAQLPYMEFRLAERYFEDQDYLKAFEHYQTILTNDPPQDLYVQSMTRVGWLVWALNNETDLAIQTLDRAIEAGPGDPLPLYVKGQILWCGLGETEPALELFGQVLATDGLDPAVVAQVEADIAIAEAGGACTQ
jgi:tetratricopeptide (TPR) repeat protein